MNHVLIVDDEAEIRESLESILREEDYLVTTAATAGEALELLRDAAYDVVLLDIWLPDRDGLDTLTEIRQMEATNVPEVVIISGHGTIEAAVRATKLGAYDFLEKPLSLDRTLIVLKNAMKARQMREDNQEFSRQLTKGTVTGNSVPMKALRQQIKLMAPTNGRVLIYGESGAGQGACRQGDACGKPAQGPSFCGTQLRGDPGGLHRERTLRLSPRGGAGWPDGEAWNV